MLIPTLQGGGAERVVLTLLRHLDRSRFSLELAVIDARSAALRHEVPQDVPFLDLGCTRVRYALIGVERLVRQRRPDVVFSTLGHLNLALALTRPFLPRGVRFIARETSIVSVNLHSLRRPWLWRWLYRAFYRRLDRVVCQSVAMRDDLVQCLGLPAAKTSVIGNPVDVERIADLSRGDLPLPAAWPAKYEGAARLLAVGRLSPEKGFDVLIEALALRSIGDVTLVILGEGPMEGQLRSLASKAGLRERVVFAGFHANPYPMLAAAEAVILSSRHEAFPNVVLEAMACGTPVIASPAPGGLREMLESVPECVIAEDGSASALASAISTWLSGPRSRVPVERLGRYRVPVIVKQYERLIESVVDPAQFASGAR